MVVDLSVRRIGPDDVALLKRVRLAALADTPSAFARTYDETVAYPDEYWVDSARERSAGPDASNFFAFDGDQVIGLAGGWRKMPERPIVDLVSMWVDPEHRGSGAASALVDAVIGWSQENAAETVELWVVRGNDRAIGFYRRCGFVETGEVEALASDPCAQELRMRLAL